MADSATAEVLNFNELLKYGPLHLEGPLSIAEFIALNQKFPALRMEREKNGRVTIITPVKKGSGRRESIVNTYVGHWALKHNNGECYSPSTGIALPSGAIKSPDCAWVSKERLINQQAGADEDFLNVIPDFVVEVRSGTDSLAKLKRKMEQTWMANGVQLGWLIDPYQEKAWVYRPGQKTESFSGFKGRTLSGEPVMPGFELPLDQLGAA